MLDTIKTNYKKIILGLALLLFLLYIFIPRSLTYMAKVHEMSIEDIDEIVIYVPVRETINSRNLKEYYFLEANEIKGIINLMDKTYVRKKLFKKKSVNDDQGYKGYFISIVSEGGYSKFPPSVHLFTDEIISFNSKQYVLYNKDFSDELDLILGVGPN